MKVKIKIMRFDYLKNFGQPLKAFLLTKFFGYTQQAFAQFLINIYFWRITHNIAFLVEYNLISDFALVLVYIFGGKIAKEYNRFLPLRIGSVLQAVYLALIIFLKNDIVLYIIPVAIFVGIAQGAYWLSDDLLKLDLTNPNNRLKFSASFRILQSTANSVVPLIASILVIADGGLFHSYSRIFILAIVFTIFVFISSFFISQKKKFESSKYDFIGVSRELVKDKNIRIALIGTGLSYVSGYMTIPLGLLLFVSSGTELSYGSYQFITVLIVVVISYLGGKYFSRKDYKNILIYGGIANFVFVFILFVSQSYGAILLYGILTALFSFSYSPQFLLTQDAFNMHCKDQEECIDKRVEYIALQQIFVNVGRGLGCIPLLFLGTLSVPWVIATVVTILASFDLISNIWITKLKEKPFSQIDNLN